MKFSIIIFAFSICILSCEEKMDETSLHDLGTKPCQVQPLYLSQTGLNKKATALSTSEKKIKGLVLIEYDGQDPSRPTGRTWQGPGWANYGWMGAIATDDKGNSYVAPAPVVSVLDNPIELQNTIYKVDSRTAVMSPYISLPAPDSSAHENPYGFLGLYFDCHARILYGASVAGSDKNKENGIIYAYDTETGKSIDELKGIDVIGLCVLGITGEKRLFAGSARNSNIYSIALDKAGKFIGEPRIEFSLDMLGPRGDDKARRIRLDKNGDLTVWGIGFNFNLTAASEKLETIYQFTFDSTNKIWVLKK